LVSKASSGHEKQRIGHSQGMSNPIIFSTAQIHALLFVAKRDLSGFQEQLISFVFVNLLC
jgi:hypothetical protein